MMILNIILLAFNMVLVPIALMLGWSSGYNEASEVDMELHNAYARLGKSVYDNLIKEDKHGQG